MNKHAKYSFTGINTKKYRKIIKNLKKQRQNSLTEISIHNKIKRYSRAATLPVCRLPFANIGIKILNKSSKLRSTEYENLYGKRPNG